MFFSFFREKRLTSSKTASSISLPPPYCTSSCSVPLSSIGARLNQIVPSNPSFFFCILSPFRFCWETQGRSSHVPKSHHTMRRPLTKGDFPGSAEIENAMIVNNKDSPIMHFSHEARCGRNPVRITTSFFWNRCREHLFCSSTVGFFYVCVCRSYHRKMFPPPSSSLFFPPLLSSVVRWRGL